MHVYMTRVISISDEAYDELKKMKNGYSFSKVIMTLTRMKKKSIMEFAGILGNRDAESMLKDIKETRKMKSRRF